MILPDHAVPVSATEWQMDCPNPDCGREKFFYNPYKERGHCKVCGLKVGSKRRFVEIFDLVDVDDWDGIAYKPPVPKFEHSRRIESAFPAWWNAKARRILRKERGFDEKTVTKSGILYSPKTNQFVAEVVTTTTPPQVGKLVRRADLSGKWQPIQPGMTLGDYVWGPQLIPPERKCVLIFEGIFDVLATRSVGWAVAMLGAKFPLPKQDWLSRRFREVILWMDPDTAGRTALQSARSLEGLGLTVHTVDFSMGDPKNADLSFVRDLLQYCKSVH